MLRWLYNGSGSDWAVISVREYHELPVGATQGALLIGFRFKYGLISV